MSLRVRLSLIVSLLFFSGMVLGVSFHMFNAQQRVADEVASTARLTSQLLQTLMPLTEEAAEDFPARLEEFLSIEDARHLDVYLLSADDLASLSFADAESAPVPGWFEKVVRPEPLEFIQPLGADEANVLLVRTNPADEIAEVWADSKTFLWVLLLVLLGLNGTLYFILGRWLRPVATIIQGLGRMEEGDYRHSIPETGLPELRSIAAKLNQLSRVLADSQLENARLRRRSLQIQEDERRYLARELHDEMGQSIAAIKAIAFSLGKRERGRRKDEMDEKSVEGAYRIESIAGQISERVRSMMGRLRPVLLDALGLARALQQMIDEWSADHEDCTCELKIEGSTECLDENQRIHVYRIVQEALTNVARHARANNVIVSLRLDNAEAGIGISDDGEGFDPAVRTTGMGLSGIRERAQVLNGDFQVNAAPGKGVSLQIRFPLEEGEDDEQ